SVRAEFPAGVFTEWYPSAGHPDRGFVLNWSDIRVRPGANDRLPESADQSRYYAAREVDAAPLEVAAEGGRGREQEKFLFYRGVGDLRPPGTVPALGGGSFAVRSAGGEPISALFLVEVRAGTVRYRRIGPLAPGASATIDLPETRSDAGP